MPFFRFPEDGIRVDVRGAWKRVLSGAFGELKDVVQKRPDGPGWDQILDGLKTWTEWRPAGVTPQDHSARLDNLRKLVELARRACEETVQEPTQLGDARSWDAYRQLRGEPLTEPPDAHASVPIVVASTGDTQLAGNLLSLKVQVLYGDGLDEVAERAYLDPAQWYLTLDESFRGATQEAWGFVTESLADARPKVDAKRLRASVCRFRLTPMDRTAEHMLTRIEGDSAQAAFAVVLRSACERILGIPTLAIDQRMIVTATLKKDCGGLLLGGVKELPAKLAVVQRAKLPSPVVVVSAEQEGTAADQGQALARCAAEGVAAEHAPRVVPVKTFDDLYATVTDRTRITLRYLSAVRETADRTPWRHRNGRSVRASDIEFAPVVLRRATAGDLPADTAEDDAEPEISAPPVTREEIPWWRCLDEWIAAHVPRADGPGPVALVTGPAGSGKSFLAGATVRRLAASAKLALNTADSGTLPPIVPLYIHAPVLASERFPFDLRALRRYLAECATSDEGFADSAEEVRPVLEKLLEEPGQVLLLIDALDEAPPDLDLRGRLRCVQKLRHSAVWTCRRGEDAAFAEEASAVPIEIFELVPLRRGEAVRRDEHGGRSRAVAPHSDVENFIRQWFEGVRSSCGRGLNARFAGSPSLQAMAALPLGLTLLCRYHEQHPVRHDTRRHEIYGGVLESWLKRSRGGGRPRRRETVFADLESLAAVAEQLFRRHPGRSAFTHSMLSSAFVSSRVCASLQDAGEAITAHSQAGTGILILSGGMYSFTHAQFLDFLVARSWMSQVQADPTAWAQLIGQLDANAWLPAWASTIVFLAGMLDEERRKELVRRLSDADRDDFFHHRRQLADNCEADAEPERVEGRGGQPQGKRASHELSVRRSQCVWPLRRRWSAAAESAKDLLHRMRCDRDIPGLNNQCEDISGLKKPYGARSQGPDQLVFDAFADHSGRLVGACALEAVRLPYEPALRFGCVRNRHSAAGPRDLARGLYVCCTTLLNLGQAASRQDRRRPDGILPETGETHEENVSPEMRTLSKFLIDMGLPILKRMGEDREGCGRGHLSANARKRADGAECLLVDALVAAAATLGDDEAEEDVAAAVGKALFVGSHPLMLSHSVEWYRDWYRGALKCPETAGVWVLAVMPLLDQCEQYGAQIQDILGEAGFLRAVTTNVRHRASMVQKLIELIEGDDGRVPGHCRVLYVQRLGEFASGLSTIAEGGGAPDHASELQGRAAALLWTQLQSWSTDLGVCLAALSALSGFSSPAVRPEALANSIEDLLTRFGSDDDRQAYRRLRDDRSLAAALGRRQSSGASDPRVAVAAAAVALADRKRLQMICDSLPWPQIRQFAWVSALGRDRCHREERLEALMQDYERRRPGQEEVVEVTTATATGLRLRRLRPFDRRRAQNAVRVLLAARTPDCRDPLCAVLARHLRSLLRSREDGEMDTVRMLERLDDAGYRFFPGSGQVGDIVTGRLTMLADEEPGSG